MLYIRSMQPCKLIRKFCVVILLYLVNAISLAGAVGEVIWAVNCGGEAHMDTNGIRYQKDYLKDGVPSDYGRSLIIQRVIAQDQILYQTERYHTHDFGYDVPVKEDGDYVLVLKFSEVWFTAPNQKVFDVKLNDEHIVVEGLDIYSKVGRGIAHDEIIPFTVRKGKLKVSGDTSNVEDGRVSVSFVKGDRDNPKVNALYVLKGKVTDVPQLPLMAQPQDSMREQQQQRAQATETTEEEEDDDSGDKKPRRSSGPKVADPYAAEETGSMMLPVFVAVGLFVPLVFCLCKL